MRRRCPACDEPFEDDGDRIYLDWCFECGWRSPRREELDAENARKLAAARAGNRLTDPVTLET